RLPCGRLRLRLLGPGRSGPHIGRLSAPPPVRSASPSSPARCSAGYPPHDARSRFEEKVDVVTQQVFDLFAQLRVRRKVGIFVEDRFRDATRLDHDRLVARNASELEIAEPRLALAEHLPGAADLEVGLGEVEAVD